MLNSYSLQKDTQKLYNHLKVCISKFTPNAVDISIVCQYIKTIGYEYLFSIFLFAYTQSNVVQFDMITTNFASGCPCSKSIVISFLLPHVTRYWQAVRQTSFDFAIHSIRFVQNGHPMTFEIFQCPH